MLNEFCLKNSLSTVKPYHFNNDNNIRKHPTPLSLFLRLKRLGHALQQLVLVVMFRYDSFNGGSKPSKEWCVFVRVCCMGLSSSRGFQMPHNKKCKPLLIHSLGTHRCSLWLSQPPSSIPGLQLLTGLTSSRGVLPWPPTHKQPCICFLPGPHIPRALSMPLSTQTLPGSSYA